MGRDKLVQPKGRAHELKHKGGPQRLGHNGQAQKGMLRWIEALHLS